MKEVRFSHYDSFKTRKNKRESSNRLLFSLPRTNYAQGAKTSSFSWSNNADQISQSNNISQSKLIDNYFGQLSVGTHQNRKRYRFHFLKNKRKSNVTNMFKHLPALTNSGSNMSNSLNTNSSNLLGKMNLEPLSNAEELISLNPMVSLYDDNYNRARVFFILSTFVCGMLLLFEMGTVILGIVYTNSCQMVDVFLVVSGCFHMIIILLEWAKVWVWGSSDNPVVPDSNSDHMQIFISCILVGLYAISIVWYTVGFAWIPTVFFNYLRQNQTDDEEIIIESQGKRYIERVPKCGENVYLFAIGYQVVQGLLFLLRMVMCCMSDFCRGLCNKFAAHSAIGGFELYSDNPLNEILPPIRSPLFKFGFKDDRNETGLITLFNTDKLSMISPIPMCSSERTKPAGLDEPLFT